MRDLIKQILKEYGEPKVTITVLSPDSPYLKQIITESKTPPYFFDSDGNYIRTSDVVDDLTRYFINHYNHPATDPIGFCGLYKDNSKSCKVLFRLGSVTDHFAYRVYRLSDPLYKNSETLVNPGRYEGIDLFFNQIHNLIKKVRETNTSDENRKDWTPNSGRHFLMIDYGVKFSIIIELKKRKVKGGLYFEVYFVTQIKGEDFSSVTKEKYKPIQVKE